MLRRVIALLDPAAPGFGRRMWRLARWGFVAAALLLLAAGTLLMRL